MEHQTISIAKAGIVTTLKSDCTVLAACSPINNIYDRTKPLSYNVPFKAPLLSRFDVHCVMSSSDELILEAAVSVLAQHVAAPGASEQHPDLIPLELLQQYIAHAKGLRPKLTAACDDILTDLYATLRTYCAHYLAEPLTIRAVESMIRMSEACAKIHLSEEVTESHVKMAAKVFLENFMETQFFAIRENIRTRYSSILNFSF